MKNKKTKLTKNKIIIISILATLSGMLVSSMLILAVLTPVWVVIGIVFNFDIANKVLAVVFAIYFSFHLIPSAIKGGYEYYKKEKLLNLELWYKEQK